MEFRLLNMRTDYAFVFFNNGTEYPSKIIFVRIRDPHAIPHYIVAVSKSNAVAFQNYYYPEHGRLALTGKPNQMRYRSDVFKHLQINLGEQGREKSQSGIRHQNRDLLSLCDSQEFHLHRF